METHDNDEVKEFVQTVNVAPSTEEETETSGEEENETPSPSSEEENKPEPEESETAEATAETEEEPEEQEAEAPKSQPKPVEGETPREKGLRLEIERVKGLLRTQRQNELFVKPIKAVQAANEELAGYDPEELARFEKLAKGMGFAKKDEILQQSAQEKNNTEFELFMEAHPEYAPENDHDGVLWNQFKSEFSLYNPPQDPKTLRKVLNKIHNEIHGVKPATSIKNINASREKIKVASHTGASAGKVTRDRPQAPSGLRTDALKGFDDDELKELLG